MVLELLFVTFGLFSLFRVRLHSFSWMIAVGLCIIASDSMANVGGKAIGKRYIRAMFSRYSPNKSWEGTIIGVSAGVVAFVLVAASAYPGSMWSLAIAGLLVATAGVWGDLQQSRMKRELDVKDASRFLGAHGGFSERLDSISRGYIMGLVLMKVFGV